MSPRFRGARPGLRRARPPAAAAAAFEAAPEPAALCSGDGRVVTMNAAARQMFGRGVAGRLGRLRLSDLVGSAGAGPLSALAGRLPAPAEARGADGGTVPVAVSVQRLGAGRGSHFAAWLGVEPAREGAGTSAPARAEALLGRLAHELNNPLAILLAQATVLHEVAPDADVARRAERIAAAAQRAGRVLADLLATSREPDRPAPPRGEVERTAPEVLSVLVVDDEEDVAASLAELLALGGHAVTVELSPAAALERAARSRFDAVFADLRMPGLDGLALRDALARLDPRLAARTVIVTGDAFPPGRLAGRVGAGLRLDKPFTLAGIRAVLDRMAAP